MSTSPVTLDFSSAVPISQTTETDRAAQALQRSLFYGTQQNPDEHARLLELQKQTGLGPEVVRPNQADIQRTVDLKSIDPYQMAVSHPRTAAWASNPDNAAVAHDDLTNLSQIEQGAARLRQAEPSRGVLAEVKSFAGNINAGVFGAFKPLIDAAGVAVQGVLQTPKALLDTAAYGDYGVDELKDIWANPHPWVIQKWTQAAQDWLTQDVLPGAPEYVADPNTGGAIKNPAYRWYGRGLVNQVEQIPGALAAFALTGKLGGMAGETAGAGAASAEDANLAGHIEPGAAVERQIVPALLGTQSAQTTYAAARAKGVDQKTAILAAVNAGMINYAFMGGMPGPAPTSTVTGAVGQWAARSVALGTGMAVSDNAIARSYDPERGLFEDVPQSIATMAAFEGAGAVGHIIDAVESSKLRTRSPEAFQSALGAHFEGDASLRIPAQDFVDYFQQKNVDPAAMANHVGVTNLEEATSAGNDLEIPKANFFGKLEPEDQKGLQPHIIDPATELTAHQSEAGKAELQDWMANGGVEKLQQEFAQADAETQASPEWQKVFSDLKQRYVDAGEKEPVADSYATLQANAIANLARKAGMKPDELLALHNPEIREGEAPAGDSLSQMPPENGAGDNSTQPNAATPAGVFIRDGREATAPKPGDALYHVVRGKWKKGEPLLSFDELDEQGSAPKWKWGNLDQTRHSSGVVSLHDNLAEALDFQKQYGGKVLRIDIPKGADALDDVAEGVNQEGYPTLSHVPADWISKPDPIELEGANRALTIRNLKREISERESALGRATDRKLAQETLDTLKDKLRAEQSKSDTSPAPGEGADEPLESPEFRQWFGESKIVDEDGKPVVAYHGTAKDFETFDLAKAGKMSGSKKQRALFFSTSPEVANHYADIAGTTGEGGRAEGAGMKVMPVYLRVENPYVSKLTEYNTADFEREIAKAKKAGHDGIVFPKITYGKESGQIAVFDPKQIKSAIGNSGAFDRNDSNILYQPRKGRPGKKANIEVARIQGEMLKGGPGAETGAEAPASEGVPAHLGDFDQADQPRGWFRMLEDGRFEIGKTAIGDFSTFVHEPAHAYLELFRELTQREGASEPLKDDFKKLTEWLGTTPEDAYKNGFTREQHEQWARANEQYVREGKAPTAGLRRAFHNFSVWLGSIYRRASALKVDLSPDIRGVMDRLYAGEEAVDRAEGQTGEPLFSSPEEAGWTEAEYRNYAEAKGIAVDKAREQVRAELNAAAERDREQGWREEFIDTRDAVTQQVDAQPEYTAIRSLRRGSLDDGTAEKPATPITLNRDALVKQFGEDRVKALQEQHRGLYRLEGGTDAETAAELFGYGSGEEMMRALEAAPRRSKAIEAATRQVMTERHGDIRYDGSLDQKAQLAVENQDRARDMHQELAALKRRIKGIEQRAANKKAAMAAIAIAPLETYQDAARQMIEQKAIADIQPTRYLNASRKYSREAFDALRKGSVERAADAKHKELLNHFLFREAMGAREYVDKFEKYVKQSVQSKGIQQRMALAGGDFRGQFNKLLWRYGLGPAPDLGRYEMPERSLRDWAAERYAVGEEPAIAPGIMDDTQGKDYRNVPLSEIRDLHDALLNLRALARQQFEMFVQGKRIEFSEVKKAMIEAARTNLRVKPERIFDENRSALDRVLLDPLRYADSKLIRMERMIEWLDGGKSGPWHDYLWNRAADAQGDEYQLQENVTRVVSDALADMPDEMRRRLWTEKVSVEGVAEPLSRRRLLSMAFNMGNEGNLDRLRKTFASFGWDPDAVRRIGGMLTREEWQFVQTSWESLKPLGERMKEMEKRLTGLPPLMVEVKPFKVALNDGTEMDLAGGYYPIKMDPRYSERAIQQDAKETAQNAMQSGYVRPTTTRGYTEARQGFGGPLLLDYEHVLTAHVAQVAKDLSHREFMLSAQRLLLDTEVRRALRETLGPEYEKQFMPWLRTIINDNNGSVQEGLDGLKDGMQKLRSNIVAASLGFNASTSLLQISHAPRMLLYAKPGSLVSALREIIASPRQAAREVRELSPSEMRFRGDNLDRDIRAVLKQPDYKAGYSRKVATAARFALELMDHLLSHTLWKAAYRDALDKYVDLPTDKAQQKAVHEADSAVRLGLGTSAPKDLPAIMRSNEFNKFITTLYGFHNGVYNQVRDIGHQFRYDRKVGKATVAGILTVIVPAVMGNYFTGRGPKQDENVGWWAAKRSLLFASDTIPILRSVMSGLEGGHDVQFSPVENVLQKGAKALMEAGSDKEDKDWLGIGLNAGESAGEIFGLPGSHQAVKTLRYGKRVHEGKVQNPNLWNAIVGGGR